MTIALILAISAWLWCEIRHALAERRWSAERNDLLSRIQAGTLSDYANHKPLLDPPERRTIAAQPEPSIADLTTFGPDVTISDGAIAEAQSSYRSVMMGETNGD